MNRRLLNDGNLKIRQPGACYRHLANDSMKDSATATNRALNCGSKFMEIAPGHARRGARRGPNEPALELLLTVHVTSTVFPKILRQRLSTHIK